MKKIFYYALLALCSTGVVACSSDDEPAVKPDVPAVSQGAFVLNQGSYYSQIEGSLTLIGENTATQNLFLNANGRSLGATPQGAVAYGSKIYIGVFESNTIEIIDRNTFKSIKQLSLADAEGQSPRSLVAKDGKVYISMFNGYVSRLDTLSLTIDKSVKVGPNPDVIAIKGNSLYVPNSDGLNYPDYGTTASKISLATFTVEKSFEVGLNPTKFVSNGTDLFLLCMGNYDDIKSQVYRINEKDESESIAEATLIDIKDNKLYYINAPYYTTEYVYSVYDVKTRKTSPMINGSGVDSPAGIGVDPTNGNIVITSYSLDNGFASYSADGYANVYTADGSFVDTYKVGVGPVCVFFNSK